MTVKTRHLFLLLILLISSIYAKDEKKVLFISSYHPDFPTFSEQIDGIQSVFDEEEIVLDIEFMDSKRFPDSANISNFRAALAYKLSHLTPYDLVISADDNALLFALEEQGKLFKGIPIVFLGVNNRERALAQNRNPQITGVVEMISAYKSVEVITKIHPELKEIAFIVDCTNTGQTDLKTFYSYKDSFPTIAFSTIDLGKLSWDEMDDELQKVSDKTVLFLISAFHDKNGIHSLYGESHNRIRFCAKKPIYNPYQFGVGSGLIGGHVISHFKQGETAAKLAVQILHGKEISTIPVVEESPNEYIFDYNELKAHNIPTTSLPESSIIINKPVSYWSKYKSIITPVIIVIIMLIALLIISTILLLKKQKREKLLKEKDERFKLLTANVPVAMMFQLVMHPDKSRKFLYVGENIEMINQVTVQQALDNPGVLYGQIEASQLPGVMKREEEALKTMSVCEHIVTMNLPNGSKRWVHLIATPRKLNNGDIIWDGVEIDIHKRIVMENELRELRSYLGNVIDSMPSALIGIDSQCKVSQLNRTAKELIDTSQEEAIGKRVEEVLPHLSQYKDEICDSVHSQRLFNCQKVLRDSTKGNICEDITVYPLDLDDENGAIIRIDNVTKEFELEKELNHSRRMDAIGQLAGGVAHDFNNMLTGIMGSTELLKSPEMGLSETALQFVDVISQAGNRSADLVSKLLSFGRKGKVMDSATDLSGVIGETIAILDKSIDKKIHITFNNSTTLSTVQGDESELQNMLMNLGINSARAMENGGTISISLDKRTLDDSFCSSSSFSISEGEYLELTFSDTGCGIAEENLTKIYDPFFTTRNQGEGSGLGLAAVYGIVKSHQGAITVESTIDVGTTFKIYLPSTELEQSTTQESTSHITDGGTVLLVDDEAIVRLASKELLQMVGYDVMLSVNGAEAVELFEKHHDKIDVIVMDMVMPHMNGFDAFYKMKEIDPDCKVIIVSGYANDQRVDEMKKDGLADFLGKPFTRSEITNAVRDAKQ